MSRALIGRNPVKEALKADQPLNKIYISQKLSSGSAGEIKAMAKERGIPVQAVEKQRLDQLAQGGNHQGVVAVAAAKEYADLDDLVVGKAAGRFPLLVLLDEINDPRNLGAILRTADAAGVDGVVIPRRRAVALTSAVAKTSAGAVEYVPVARVTNMVRTMDYLKEKGFWIAGAHGTGEQIYWDADFNVPLAIVVGGEDKGLSRLIRSKCDFLVQMPMAGRVGSLNASVAVALLLYEVLRQRRRD
ncbi:MAG: 23S rRNA (guanosine(2251)-2'-O)-methyltransferase RlmB [Firmicutes bacterium]|nr:23S rRNA (guanosine(2251)-2'-O)-methyltransferase RlmB [Bacillota bacterium]